MNGYPNIRKGWWQRENQWSWSWAVAHSFYWYLSGATTGLRAEAVERPEELILGDVIAYDFEDDGRWNHTTIVVADADGMPLVNRIQRIAVDVIGTMKTLVNIHHK